jgi:transcriptional regulator with XRE-family HTH domain
MTDKEFLKQLGLKLKCQRIMVEMEIKDVADKSGLHRSTINKMESGIKDFHILNLRRLVDVYGIEMKEVL